MGTGKGAGVGPVGTSVEDGDQWGLVRRMGTSGVGVEDGDQWGLVRRGGDW